jgi:hypothetical protein
MLRKQYDLTNSSVFNISNGSIKPSGYYVRKYGIGVENTKISSQIGYTCLEYCL